MRHGDRNLLILDVYKPTRGIGTIYMILETCLERRLLGSN